MLEQESYKPLHLALAEQVSTLFPLFGIILMPLDTLVVRLELFGHGALFAAIGQAPPIPFALKSSWHYFFPISG